MSDNYMVGARYVFIISGRVYRTPKRERFSRAPARARFHGYAGEFSRFAVLQLLLWYYYFSSAEDAMSAKQMISYYIITISLFIQQRFV